MGELLKGDASGKGEATGDIDPILFQAPNHERLRRRKRSSIPYKVISHRLPEMELWSLNRVSCESMTDSPAGAEGRQPLEKTKLWIG